MPNQAVSPARRSLEVEPSHQGRRRQKLNLPRTPATVWAFREAACMHARTVVVWSVHRGHVVGPPQA